MEISWADNLKTFILVIFLLNVPGIYSQCPEFFSFKDRNRSEQISVEVKTNNSICYAKFADLEYALKQLLNNQGFKKISSIDESFFCMIEKNDDIFILQMNLPSYMNNGTLYLPIISFFQSLGEMNIFEFELISNMVITGEKQHQKYRLKSLRHYSTANTKRNIGNTNLESEAIQSLSIDEDELYNEILRNIRLLNQEIEQYQIKENRYIQKKEINYIDTNQLEPPSRYSIPTSILKSK